MQMAFLFLRKNFSLVAEIERENIRVQTMEGRIQKARAVSYTHLTLPTKA